MHAHFLQGLLDRPQRAAKVSSATEALLASITNKFPVEAHGNTVGALESLVERVTDMNSADDTVDDTSRLALMGIVAIVTGAIMRHAKGGGANSLLQKLIQTPIIPRIGQEIGRRLQQVVAPILDQDGSLSVVLPTWKAKTYHQFVRPMLERALPRPDVSNGELLRRLNYRVAVLGMLRWMDFAIYEDDVDMILRASICLAQGPPCEKDAASSLWAIKTVLERDPNAAKSHLDSLVQICQQAIRNADSPVFHDVLLGSHACQILALDILLLIGQKYEKDDAQIRSVATAVNRTLTIASGLGSRSIREKARLARGLWRTIKA